MWAFVLSYFASLCLIAVSLEAYSLLKGDRGELILERGKAGRSWKGWRGETVIRMYYMRVESMFNLKTFLEILLE